MPSFSSVIPFDIFLSFFVCSFPEVLLCSTKVMSSCTLLRIQNSFPKFSGECSLESYRCCFPPLVGTLFPASLFSSLSNKVCSVLVSFSGRSLSIHLVRSLPRGQVNIPSFWKTPPSPLEVDESLLLGYLKH